MIHGLKAHEFDDKHYQHPPTRTIVIWL
jgi:hypothetical protein